MIPFLLALMIFIVSNFIQQNLSKEKKRLEGRISEIDKSLSIYLQYNFISTINYNFGQHYLNGVIESTLNENAPLRDNYMRLVIAQMKRALSALQESSGSLQSGQTDDIDGVMKELNNFDPADGFDSFYTTFLSAVESTELLQEKINSTINTMSDEKIQLRNHSVEISSKDRIILNIVIALNFLILLFAHIEKTASRHENKYSDIK